MSTAHPHVVRRTRISLWVVACVTAMSLGGWASTALADGTADGCSPAGLALPQAADALDAPGTQEPAPAADLAQDLDRSWTLAMDPSGPRADAGAAGAAAPAKKGPPLPLYTVEGTGGGLIVPMAYMVNPGPPGTTMSGPTTGYTFVKIGKKIVQQVSITETFYRRLEVSYALGTLYLGDWPGDVVKHGLPDVSLDYVVVHNFNLRGLVVEEQPNIPAITAGVTFKYNPTVQTMDRRLGHAPRALGMERSNGTDFTLHASKTIPNLVFGRPVMATAGIRFSQGAQLGYLGFSDTYRMTAEASLCCPITDWMAMVYEYRQKKNPYHTAGNVVGNEDDWHTICLAFILSDRLAVACGWGHFGNVVNHHEDGVWGFQLKYEF